MFYLVKSETGEIIQALVALPGAEVLQAMADTSGDALRIIQGERIAEYEPIPHPILAGAPLFKTSERWTDGAE